MKKSRRPSGFGQPARHVNGGGPRCFCVQCGERCAPPEGRDVCELCRRYPGVVVRFCASTGRRLEELPAEVRALAWAQESVRTEYV